MSREEKEKIRSKGDKKKHRKKIRRIRLNEHRRTQTKLKTWTDRRTNKNSVQIKNQKDVDT